MVLGIFIFPDGNRLAADTIGCTLLGAVSLFGEFDAPLLQWRRTISIFRSIISMMALECFCGWVEYYYYMSHVDWPPWCGNE